jgi:hypothetical protein
MSDLMRRPQSPYRRSQFSVGGRKDAGHERPDQASRAVCRRCPCLEQLTASELTGPNEEMIMPLVQGRWLGDFR